MEDDIKAALRKLMDERQSNAITRSCDNCPRFRTMMVALEIGRMEMVTEGRDDLEANVGDR